jgi:hypothetical protein
MLNWLSKEFFLAVIAAPIIALIAVSWGGTPDQYMQQQRSEQSKSDQGGTEQPRTPQIDCDPACAAKNSNEIRKPSLGMRIANKLIDDPVTLGILIANFLLVVVVLTQVRDTREATKRELRAYLTVVIGGAVYQERPKNLRFEAKPMMLNTGRTPAHKVRYRAAAQILTHPLPPEFGFNVETAFVGSGILGLGGNFILNAVVPDFVDDAEVSPIKQGRAVDSCLFGET